MKAGLYARVSTKDQAQEGFSIDAQLRALRQYCDQHQYAVVDAYVDEGLSAAKEPASSRPEFSRLLRDIEDRKVNVIVVHKLDRLSRNLNVTFQTFKKLEECGAKLVSLSENLDASSPNGRLMVNFMASIAEWYSDNLASEVSKGRRERFEQGLPNGDIPFGYMAAGPRMPPELVLSEAELVKAAYERYSSGQYSFSQVADWLNLSGTRPRSKNGRTRFTADSVRDMVCNSFYRAMVKYRGEERSGQHVATVSDSIWYRCQDVRAQRRTATAAVKRVKSRRYLLQGIARCSRCDSRLWCQQTRFEPRYQDNARQRKHLCTGKRASVSCAEVDAQVGNLVKGMRIDDRWRAYGNEILVAAVDVGKVARERERLKERLSRLKELYLDVVIGRSQWQTEGAEIRAQLQALDLATRHEAELAAIRLGEFGECWDAATHAERADFCSLIFEAVWVDLDTGTVVSVKPRPPFREAFSRAMQWPGDPERIRTADLHLDRVAC
jgi:site-specific DNA recombinase